MVAIAVLKFTAKGSTTNEMKKGGMPKRSDKSWVLFTRGIPSEDTIAIPTPTLIPALMRELFDILLILFFSFCIITRIRPILDS